MPEFRGPLGNRTLRPITHLDLCSLAGVSIPSISVIVYIVHMYLK